MTADLKTSHMHATYHLTSALEHCTAGYWTGDRIGFHRDMLLDALNKVAEVYGLRIVDAKPNNVVSIREAANDDRL